MRKYKAILSVFATLDQMSRKLGHHFRNSIRACFFALSGVQPSHYMFKRRRLFVILMTLGLLFRDTQAQTPSQPGAKIDYSKEAVVDEDDTTKDVFENDGTSMRVSSARLRIQSDAGVQRFSVLSFPYQESTETVEIVYVRVHKPDGTVIVTPAENVLDMPSDITRQAPFYSDLHEKHVAVKGLTVGDVLESQVRWHLTKPLAPGQFWFAFYLPHDSIVLHKELEVTVPGERAVKWKSPTSKPVIREESGRRVFTWTFSQLEHQSSDEDKASLEKKTYQATRGKLPPPDIQLSSFQSWAEVGAWYDGMQLDRVKASPEIRAKAAELTKNADDDTAKLHAIYNYVSTQFRYIGVAFGIGRYQPHTAADVLANQYGDCKDKHTLLASLLDAAGIKAYPALINSSHELDPDLPSPQQFDHVITAVPQAKGFLWLDTTTEVAPFGYLLSILLDKQALVMPGDSPAALVTTPVNLPIKALRTFRMEAKLDDTGTLEGKVEQSVQGQDGEVLLRKGFRSTPQPQWKELVQQVSYALGFGGEVSDVSASQPDKTDEPWHISYSYKRKDYPDWANKHLNPPLPPIVLPVYVDDATKPTVPVWLGAAMEIDLHSQVELPKGYVPVLPAAVNLKEEFAEFHASYGIKDGKLTTERHLITKAPEIPVSAYDHYKKFMKAIEDDHNAYIETSSGGAASEPTGIMALMGKIRNLPNSDNPAAMEAESDAREAAQRGDLPAAIASLQHAVELDPKFTRDWLMLGGMQMSSRSPDEALVALRHAVDLDATQVLPLQMLGFAQVSLKKYEEAVTTFRRIIEIAPDDVDAHSNLGNALQRLKRYPEAAAAYEAALKLSPDRAGLALQMGTAYLRTGDEAKALAAYKKTLELSSAPVMYNDIAYELADANKQLPLALEYAEKAVRDEEEASAKIKLSDLTMKDLNYTFSLAAFWDTLGWVHFRLGNYQKAEQYLEASWTLSPGKDQTDHLAQVHKQQHKNPRPVDLNFLRTTKVPRLTPETANAEFFVILARDPKTSEAKVQEVKFISGSDKLRSPGKALSTVSFKFPFPDDGPSHLVRRGILGCYPVTGCSFVPYNIQDVHSIN